MHWWEQNFCKIIIYMYLNICNYLCKNNITLLHGATKTLIIMKINSFSKNSSCRGHSLIMYFSCWLRNMKSTNKTLLVEKPKHVMHKQVLTPRIPISRRISLWPYHVIWVCVWNMCSNVINNGDINDSRAIMLKNKTI